MNPIPCPSWSRIAAAILASAGCLFVLAAPVAHAQSPWNRRMEAVAVTEAGTAGQYDLHAVLELHGDGESSVPQDLSTEIEVRINGTAAAMHTVPVGLDPGAGLGCVDAAACGGSCGTGSVDGLSQTLLCLADGECSPLCDCKCKFPPVTWTLPGQSLEPGDEITVILRPAPGALPDADSSDDQMGYVFAEPVFWDRTIAAVTLEPSPPTLGGDSFFDIWFDITAYHEGLASFLPAGEAADLGMNVELEVNGVPHASAPCPSARSRSRRPAPAPPRARRGTARRTPACRISTPPTASAAGRGAARSPSCRSSRATRSP
jgi:hypothetical protein